eukprot:TRINITY_DN6448_c0_g1_i1.p1 TRINITY_DN6448_c0_g1~~TRINITY_DN6448_c0_g1_i1.p1  ORF type:complete len:487 (+),score=155.88 TRINITY_DN6448_c0_g1_i1:105-1565(+)
MSMPQLAVRFRRRSSASRLLLQVGCVAALASLAGRCALEKRQAFAMPSWLQRGSEQQPAPADRSACQYSESRCAELASQVADGVQAAEAPWSFGSLLAGCLMMLAVISGFPRLATAADNSKVAPCLLTNCRSELASCIADPLCAVNLSCVIGCGDDKTCQIGCGDNFQDDVIDNFNACALSKKKCVPRRPDTGPLPGTKKWTPVEGRYPVPPPESVSKDFDVTTMNGAWFISAGLNPLFDTFDCQLHFFEGTAPQGNEQGRLVGKINWRVTEPDGEFLTRATVQNFLQRPNEPGVLENHDNEYLHYQDDWYVLDHGFEDDPNKGFVLIYYRGNNDAWAGYGGGTLYTRTKYVPPEILDRVKEACLKAKVPFDKYWETTDNSCIAAEDTEQLRERFAKQLLETSAMSVEAQLTLLQRQAYQTIDKDEQYLFGSAAKLEKMTEDFAKKNLKQLKKVEAKAEKNIEKIEKTLESPLVNLLNFLQPNAGA